MNINAIKVILDNEILKWNTYDFIQHDPISIPKKFTILQDIEISALFAALFAWGKRSVAINKTYYLLNLMNNKPYEFIQKQDHNILLTFKHRTFNGTDIIYLTNFLRDYYTQYNSLENLFIEGIQKNDTDIGNGIHNFSNNVLSSISYPRIKKHISSPINGSACKRINLFLRWMVRNDNIVDFGIWKQLKPNLLVCPCDVHVMRVSQELGLLKRKQVDWQAAIELTNNLKKLDPNDPIRYDFGLFGMGINNNLLKKVTLI